MQLSFKENVLEESTLIVERKTCVHPRIYAVVQRFLFENVGSITSPLLQNLFQKINSS